MLECTVRDKSEFVVESIAQEKNRPCNYLNLETVHQTTMTRMQTGFAGSASA